MSSESSEELITRKRKKEACRSGFRRRRKIVRDISTSSENDEDLSPEQRLASVHEKLSDVDLRLISCRISVILMYNA